MQKTRLIIRRVRPLLILVFSTVTHFSFSQTDSTKIINQFGGAASVTNNGISLIPTFSLGDPAAIFDMSVGRKLTFEPQLRFALEGKPWSFILWWRYKLLSTGKFRVGIGAHPSFVFRTVSVLSNGASNNLLVAQRYFASELVPNYFLKKNISIGLYYLHSYGLGKDAVQRTNFITVNSNFSNIKLTKQFFLKFNPQLYYLVMDGTGGYSVTSTLTLARKNFPLSIYSIMNKVILVVRPTQSGQTTKTNGFEKTQTRK